MNERLIVRSVSTCSHGNRLTMCFLVKPRDTDVNEHLEQTMLVPGPDGRDRLYVAHSESSFVAEMVETEEGSGRFEQPQPIGPYSMAIVIEIPEPSQITYAWWWSTLGEELVEQSKADARLYS